MLTAEALLTVLLAHGLMHRQMLISRIVDTFASLGPSQRHDVGLARQVTRRMVDHAIDRVMADAGDTPSSDGLTDFCNKLLAASLEAAAPRISNSIAIDSTDYETFGRRRSWASQIDVDPDSLPVPQATRHKFTNEPGWPRIGPDGRFQHTADPDARDGYRSGRNGKPGEVFCGYDLHLAVPISDRDHPATPLVIVGMHLAPAGAHKGRAGIDLIDSLRMPTMPGRHLPISEVVADRGYTYCTAPTWIEPLWSRGIEPTSDLHPNQRGTRPGNVSGTLWIDGALFSADLPEHLRSLKSFTIGMSKSDREDLHAQYDQRAQWAFTPHGKRQPNGRQRLKGPALDRRVRCRNHPPSIRLDHRRPTTRCESECACGKTITVGPEDYPATQQRHVYGTTAWGRSYHRRNRVESANAELKHHRQNFTRGFTRVLNRAKTAFLLAFAIVGVNVAIIDGATDSSPSSRTNTPSPKPRRRVGTRFHQRRERRKIHIVR